MIVNGVGVHGVLYLSSHCIVAPRQEGIHVNTRSAPVYGFSRHGFWGCGYQGHTNDGHGVVQPRQCEGLNAAQFLFHVENRPHTRIPRNGFGHVGFFFHQFAHPVHELTHVICGVGIACLHEGAVCFLCTLYNLRGGDGHLQLPRSLPQPCELTRKKRFLVHGIGSARERRARRRGVCESHVLRPRTLGVYLRVQRTDAHGKRRLGRLTLEECRIERTDALGARGGCFLEEKNGMLV